MLTESLEPDPNFNPCLVVLYFFPANHLLCLHAPPPKQLSRLKLQSGKKNLETKLKDYR